MKRIDDIPICGDPIQDGALQQIKQVRQKCEFAALMADHHVGYAVPIGGVMASQEMISPSAVGFDIACGNRASLVDANTAEVRANIAKIMDDIVSQISFGIGRHSKWEVDNALFSDPLWNEAPALQQTNKKGKSLRDLAFEQLGTVGSGNHYVDIMVDEQDRVWIGVHFGSRGFGHRVASWFLDALNASHDSMAYPAMVHQTADLGEQYIKCMELAGRYAYAGRDAVVEKVAEILGANILETVHNHHNFAWRETHDGRDYWVCRKGATPAFPGQRGFVGGSMGDEAVIIEGIESRDSQALFYSTIHGAGRVMSRTKATGRSTFGKQKFEGAISRESMRKWVQDFGVELRGADTDEAPQAYKRLAEVLPQQGDTIRVLHRLRPIGVAMAGKDVFDPYKD